MKINKKYYDYIDTEPNEVQNLELGTVQIYSMNDYPSIHELQKRNARFSMWINKGGNDYKLLVDDEYKNTLQGLYVPEVNNVWLEYYNNLDKEEKRARLTHQLPTAIVFSLILVVVYYFLPLESTGKLIASVILLILVLLVNKALNKIVTKKVNILKDAALDKIGSLIGQKNFDDLLNKQNKFLEDYYKKLYVEKYGEEGYENTEPEQTIQIEDGNKEILEIIDESEETN